MKFALNRVLTNSKSPDQKTVAEANGRCLRVLTNSKSPDHVDTEASDETRLRVLTNSKSPDPQVV